jgi:general secretion pathway protein B
MSFILDALRKAERERNLGRPPGTSDLAQAASPVASPPSNKRRVRLTLAILLLALLVAAAIGWWSHSAKPARVETPAAATPAPVAVATTAESPMPAPPLVVVPAAPEAPVPPRAANPAPDVVQDSSLATLDELADADSADEDFGEEEIAEPAEGGAAAAAEKPKPTPPPPSVEPSAAPAEETAAVAAPPGTRLLRDMPSDFRASFPVIAFQVHVYKDDPAKRWIMINDKRYAEGGALEQGPRIVEILSNGVVFEHRGEKVMVPLTR